MSLFLGLVVQSVANNVLNICETRHRKGIKYIEKRRKSIICWYANS